MWHPLSAELYAQRQRSCAECGGILCVLVVGLSIGLVFVLIKQALGIKD